MGILNIFLLYIFATCIRGQSTETDASSRIVNGQPAGPVIGGLIHNTGEFPFIVAIEVADIPTCGGSIIKDDVVLTAAHCTDLYTTIPFLVKVRAGTYVKRDFKGSRVQLRLVQEIINHPKYNISAYNDNDISILKLKTKFLLNNFVNVIHLPDQQYQGDDDKRLTMIIGWGLNEKFEEVKNLQRGQVSIISNSECSKLTLRGYEITKNMICTLWSRESDKKQSICKGDSGGPMFLHDPENPKNDQLIGITSYGRIINKALRRECDVNSPAVYANVFAFKGWIMEVLKNH